MLFSWLKRKPQPNAICDYCLSLTSLAPGEQITCGFCESELMRAMNFFIPIEDFFKKNSLADLEKKLADTIERKKTAPKKQQFYYKDAIAGLKEVIALRKRYDTASGRAA